jgi:hypothetical protein
VKVVTRFAARSSRERRRGNPEAPHRQPLRCTYPRGLPLCSPSHERGKVLEGRAAGVHMRGAQTGTVRHVEPQSRILSASDLEAILGVLVVVHGHLLADELPPDLTRRLISRLRHHGPLPADATPGELNALLADLCQRMHWAMSEDPGGYPGPAPRRTMYFLDIPNGQIVACTAALLDLGGEVSRQSSGDSGTSAGWQLAASFPELPPDPGHHARVAQLSSLASRHGGQFSGFSG